MIAGVVGIEHDHDVLAGPDARANRLDYRRIGGTAFDQGDAPAHRVTLDGQTVVLADLDVYPDDSTTAQKLEQRGVEDQGAPMGYSALNDDVRSLFPDQLLDHQDVFGELNDRDPEPGDLV